MQGENEIPLYPVASWQIGPVYIHGIVTFRPNFLDAPNQNPDDAHYGRHYALTPVQVRDLISDLQKALHNLEKSETQGQTKQTH